MASKLLMNGYPFFMCLVLFGYEANIGPSLEETPKVYLFCGQGRIRTCNLPRCSWMRANFAT